ncbi:MAG: MFS transporter [Candidatus Aminicenantes bacterium]|nr:MAG: MFS transporter [Candidatus Aminicenantes bacterium]
MTNIRSNLRKIYVYKFLSDFLLIVPIIIPFYKSNHLNTTQIFIVQSAYAAAVLILEIPSGYFSDVMGRKKTLVLGALFLPVGFGIYAISTHFMEFILAEILLAISTSMRSGTDSAFIYDTLLQLKEESLYRKFEGKALFFTRAGSSISSVSGGLLALIALRFPFYLNIIPGVIMVFISFYLVEPEREKRSAENPFIDILKIAKSGLTNGQIRSLMLFSSLIFSTGVIGVWSYFLYYEVLGINVGFYGFLFAIFGLWSGLGAKNSHALAEKIGKRHSVFVLLIVSFTFAALGLLKSLFLIPIIFLIGFIWGFSGPLLLEHLNKIIASDVRATVLSVNNMAGSLSYIILSPVFGRLVDVYSLSSAYLVMAVYFFVIGSLSVFLLIKNKVIRYS